MIIFPQWQNITICQHGRNGNLNGIQIFINGWAEKIGDNMKDTGVMCLITINDENEKDGIRHIDIGNYFLDEKGNKCVITTYELARKYHNLIDCDIYIRE